MRSRKQQRRKKKARRGSEKSVKERGECKRRGKDRRKK